MNVISSVMRSFGRVVFNGGGALISAISTGRPALMIAAMAGTVFSADLTWVGDDSSNLWNINTSQMWTDGSGAAVYTDGDAVTLDDTGSASPSIDLTATVQPASIMVNITNKSYAITGTGTLAGAMTLTKEGTNTLTLSTANTFTGAVADNAGTLDFAPPGTATMNNVFTGSGTFVKSGSSLLVVGGNEKQNASFYGPVTVNGGILRFGTSQWNKYRGLYHASSYTINSGATLSLYGQGNMNNAPIIVNGGTLQMFSGYNQMTSFTLNGGTVDARAGLNATYNTFALIGTITVTGTEPSRILSTGSSYNSIHMGYKTSNLSRTFTVADVTGDTNADLIVSARLIKSAEVSTACSLVKTGEGTMILSAANAYAGTTTVSAGTLLVSGSLDSPTVNVNSGGALLVSSSSPLPKATVTIASNGTFGVAGTVATSVTNLTFAEGAKVAWTYDGGAQTAGLVNVTGTLTLPTAATVNLTGTGALRSDQVLFSAATVEGATDLSGWTINNVPEGTYASILLIDKQVILKTVRGTVILIL